MGVSGGKDPTLHGDELIDAVNKGWIDWWSLTPEQRKEVDAWEETSGQSTEYYGLGQLGKLIDSAVNTADTITNTYYEQWTNDTSKRMNEQAASLIMLRQGLESELQTATGAKYADLYYAIQRLDETLKTMETKMEERTGKNPNYMQGVKYIQKDMAKISKIEQPTYKSINTDTGQPTTITSSIAEAEGVKEELSKKIEDYPAGDFPGAPGGPMYGTAAKTPSWQTKMTSTASPEAQAEKMTDAEYYWMKAIQEGKRTVDELQKLWPGVYESLKAKGKLPSGAAPTTAAPTTAAPTDTGEQIKQMFTQAGMTPKAGNFPYPEGGYTENILKLMLQYGTPEERATALQQMKINKPKAAPKGGFIGARVPGQQEPMGSEVAQKVTNKLSKEGEFLSGLSDEEIRSIAHALSVAGSGGEMLLKEFPTKEAEEKAMKILGYNYYPATKEGYGGVYGGGKPVYRQFTS
jgi:hypothetical protein